MTVKNFKVFIEENSHYDDETTRRKFGEFASFDNALKACQEIVDYFLKKNYQSGMNTAELFQIYTMFGEDAFIVGDSSDGNFSAWQYAEECCRQICENDK